MKKVRNSALGNGIAIGFGMGCFFVAAINHELVNGINKILAIHDIPPTTELGVMTYVCIIAGILFLAAGIGIEAYQRGRIKPEEK